MKVHSNRTTKSKQQLEINRPRCTLYFWPRIKTSIITAEENEHCSISIFRKSSQFTETELPLRVEQYGRPLQQPTMSNTCIKLSLNFGTVQHGKTFLRQIKQLNSAKLLPIQRMNRCSVWVLCSGFVGGS